MGAFEEGYKRLNGAQKQAVDQIDGPLLVIAGPGTGKTQLLALRVANILKKTDTDASSILCLTFTESAQTTMQTRLLSFIDEAAYRVSVQTFHSFAGEVIVRFNQYFDEQVSSSVADTLTSFEILQAIFASLPYGHPLVARDGDQYVHLASVRQRISHLKQAGLQPPQLRDLVARDLAWVKKAEPLICDVETQVKPALRASHLPLYEKLLVRWQKLQPSADLLHGFEPLGWTATQTLQQALADCAELGNKTTPLSAWRRQWLNITRDGCSLKDTARLTRLNAVADIYEPYQTALQARHLRDFDDLILNVTEGMQQNADLRAALQEQFQYILVDEYQDTNGVQQTLLELLADSPVNEGRPNLMVVGDDDQAIYGFQGANPTYMRRFVDRWRQVVSVALTENYRSTPEVVNLSRAVIEQAGYHQTSAEPFIARQLTSTRPAGSIPELRSYPHSLELYWSLAEDIAQRIASGTSADTIAIIAPRHRMLAALVPYLLAKNIPLNYERRDNVLEQPHIKQLLCMAEVIQALADDNLSLADSLLPELLSYPYWRVSTEQLWQLQVNTYQTQQTNWLEMLRQQKGDVAQIAVWLLAAARQANSQPLDVMFDILLGNEVIEGQASPFREYYFSDDRLDTEPALYVNLLSSLNTLRRRLQNWHTGGDLQLRHLLAFVQLARQAGEYIVDTHPLILGTSSVHVLTAHKAKGQEFSIVYMLETDQAHWVQDKGRPSTISLPANLPIEPEPEEVDEKLRRFYVGLTRSADELILTQAEQTDDGKPVLPLVWLTPKVVKDQLAIMTPRVARSTPELRQSLVLDWRQRHLSELEANASLREILAERLANYHLSASHLNSFLNLRYGGPKVWLTEKLLGFPHQTGADAAYGTAIHAVLERQHHRVVAGRQVSLEVALEDLASCLQSQPLETSIRAQLLDRGRRALEIYIPLRAADFSATQRAEYEVGKNQIVVGEARLYGKIDLLDIDPKSKTIKITDYKTGRSFNDWQPRDSGHKWRLHGYRRQLIFYKLLIEGSREWHGYNVVEGRLDFVEPDETGQINQLSMSFDEAEVNDTKQLIAAIWNHMITLDLPQPAGDTPSSMRAFETSLLSSQN